MNHLTVERIREILAAFNSYNALHAESPHTMRPGTQEGFDEVRRLNTSPEWREYLQALQNLTPDELLELAAVFYLGRGTGCTFEDGLREARNIPAAHLVTQISEKGTLDRMIPIGLQKLGIQL